METFHLFCALIHLTTGTGEVRFRNTGALPGSLRYPAFRGHLTTSCKPHSKEYDAFWPPRVQLSRQALIYMWVKHTYKINKSMFKRIWLSTDCQRLVLWPLILVYLILYWCGVRLCHFVFNFRELFVLNNDIFLGVVESGWYRQMQMFEAVFTADPPVFTTFSD